ncbi:MAG TPA: BadF/BadG/BcrA/BcrD ATPase family protein [Actinophytocola sp.]|jgi:N-acetylglucosamine kinase-like BadF-type ATPase|nr:BadF/BadG/BcrA/BcrD ATPase family protein [Actinophytocola sp.]
MDTASCVVGVDAGATSTRALAAAPDGTVVGRGAAGGGNPNSHPPELAGKRVAEAVRDAIAGGGEVRACVLGMAGASKFTDPAVVETFTSALRHVGVSCPIEIVSDAEVAFASGTAEPDGVVVIGGTGSVAARIVDHRMVSWVGGLGWMLGDEGSAYWMGREAVRVTLRRLQTGEPPSPLGEAVLRASLPGLASMDEPRLANRLITAANAEPPIRLARFASTVSEHAATDPVAAAIVAAAADLLARLATDARPAEERTPIVLAGSVIGPGSPVGVALRAALAGYTPVTFAPDGTVGAAWLAALSVDGPDAPRPVVSA